MSLPLFLWAGLPMKTHDPFVPDLGTYEINLSFSSESRDATLKQFPIIDANYGIAKDVELTLATAYTHFNDENDVDAFEVAIKWLMYEGDMFAIAINPAYFSFPHSSAYHTGETHEISIPLSFRISPSVMIAMDSVYINPKNEAAHIEFGSYIRVSHNSHHYFFDLYSDDISSKRRVPLLISLGYTYEIDRNYAFLISYGKEAITQSTKATFFYSALQLAF